MNDDVLALMRLRLCSPQWAGVVRALGDELATELSDDQLGMLLHRVGVRFASSHPLGAAATLEAMAASANRTWAAIEWGVCRFDEEAGHVKIRHWLAPIGAVFPDAAWSDGFLHGVYQRWFDDVGLPAGLAVRVEASESPDVRCFTLARAA